MSEEKKPYEPPPPDLNRPPEPPPPAVPVDPPPPEPKQKASSVRVTEDSSEEDEGVPGGIPPVNTRIIAAIIDLLVATGIYWTAAMILPDVLDRLSWILWAAYLVTRDSLPFLKGQSIGKMAMKLKVEKQGGGDITGDWQAAIVRNIALLIPLFGLVEAIVLFTREDKPEKGLRLGDEWAKTKVVVAGSSGEAPSGEES
ncbi:RDD family protein [Haloferula sp. A504]|uniref:RDD family protein n=1 Tax=Haloferula sp. A504 TaxID=3373601 RepID=UPI0031C4F517|nr:RDD family protein [Verrucomicrobiaceae bacterium E54]